MSQRITIVPGRSWRVLRRTTQLITVTAVLVAPVLGGWQRTERAELATVEDTGWNLPRPLLDRLPAGPPAARAYRANKMLGGGTAADYLGVPAMDPLVGALALIGGGLNLRSVLALGLPLLLALVAGRVFCGWLCIYGVLARLLDRVRVFVPFLPRLRLPSGRPLRFAVLGIAVAASVLGFHLLLYLSLPYLLLQQSVYAAWLLGGGSVVLSVLLGIVAAGMLFGPTLYCAALCPTGAVLGLAGRARVVRLQVVDRPSCGKHCGMCNSACWLQLQPREGDPGPDCDLCGRCVPVCPKTNLHVTVGWKTASSAPAPSTIGAAATILLGLAALLSPASAQADGLRKPTIVIERELRLGDATLVVSALDVEGTTLQRDWGVDEVGTDIDVYLTRGPLQPPGEDGIIEGRPFYRGPLTVEVRTPGREAPAPLRFERANHPISAQRPSIYRARIAAELGPGDSVIVHPVKGYFSEPVEVFATDIGTRASARWHLGYFLTSLLIVSGLLSLALAWPFRDAQPLEAD